MSRILQKPNLWLIACLLLSSCAVGPNYEKPQTVTPAVWKQQDGQPSAEQHSQEQWWKSFHDQTLDSLIAQALEQSHDRKIAEARILEARGLRMNSASALYPQINASGTAERGNPGLLTQNNPINLYQGGFDASYELDLFGGNRRDVEASDAIIESREASYRNVTITLVAEVVNEYATLRELQRRYKVTENMAQSQKQLARFSKIKYDHGAASSLEVSQTDALYRDTVAKLPVLARDITATIYRVSVLTGSENDEVVNKLQQAGQIPTVTHAPIMDAPATVLSRRPDVAEAERNLAANTALTGEAISELYPKISLSAMFGWENSSILPSTNPWGLASGITMPLLNFGRIQGNIKAADARQQQSFQTYKKSVVAAIADVETKISDYSKNKEHSAALKEALESNRHALDAAHKRYDRGLTPLIDVLEAETKVYDAENNYLTSQADEVRSVAALEKAGGL